MSLEEFQYYSNIMRNYFHEIHKLNCMDFKDEFGELYENLNIMRSYIHEIHKLTSMDFKDEFGGIT